MRWITSWPKKLPAPDWVFHGPRRAKRVLIETDECCLAWAAERALVDAGYDVATCSAIGDASHGRCPLLDGERCLLVEDADVIVRSFDLQAPDRADIVDAVAATVPETRVIEIETDRRGD